jgi:hypothetical protein
LPSELRKRGPTATPEDEGQAPDDGAAERGWRARLKKYWKYWVPVLTAAVVIPLVAKGAGLIGHQVSRVITPEQYLAIDVIIPSPGHVCEGGRGWVFDKDPQQLSARPWPTPGSDDKWAAENGGIPASGNYIEVHLHALNGHKVTVPTDGIQVEIKSKTEPPHGTYPGLSGGCGGLTPYQFSLNLDTNPIAVTAKPDEGILIGLPDEKPRRIELPQEITPAETEVWHLAAVTETCTCEWTVTLDWIPDDGTGKHTSKITDQGHPFRVAATTRATPVFIPATQS